MTENTVNFLGLSWDQFIYVVNLIEDDNRAIESKLNFWIFLSVRIPLFVDLYEHNVANQIGTGMST